MICCKSYQDIPEDPRYAGPDTEDYFDMFLTAWCKANGVKDVNNKDYEIIKRYWYEFENGNGEEPDHNSDMTLEEMNAELKEYDENREKHTCETCERKRDEIFCSHCRTGCNDDYTLSDYWHSYTRVEKLLWGRIAQLQNDKGELTDKCRELEQQIEKLIDFVISKTECCDVCPITDTCINSEGNCPYVGILAKSEEEVTREWLMQFISRR